MPAAAATTAPPTTYTAFFYGTLMAPSVLHRVTNRQPPTTKAPLAIRPALLPGFRRHRVKHCDYPAIVPAPAPSSSGSDTRGPASDVRGTFVAGLTREDVRRLDAFEGSEYERRFVRVRLLPPPPSPAAAVAGAGAGAHASASAALLEQTHASEDFDAAADAEAEAQTYVWIADRDDLEDAEWDFDEFVREKLWLWADGEGDRGFQDAAGVVAAGGDGEDASFDPTGGRSVVTGEFEKRMLDL